MREKQSRLIPLDLLRGTLIVLMALDHANFFIAHQHSSGEYWGGAFPVFPTSSHFLVRFVTHLCAPGFFFLLGVGLPLFDASRRTAGWSPSEIRRHFLLRGGTLIAAQLLLDLARIWSAPGSPAPLWYGGVLAALGVGMILAVPLLQFKPLYLVLGAGGLLLALELLTPAASAWGLNFDSLPGVLLVYGGGQGSWWVNYPLLAWMELVLFGMFFGKLILQEGSRAFRVGGWLGGCLLAGFAVVRGLNGFGTIRPLPADDWMGFLSLVKYPPSIAYVLLTLGINLLLLDGFSYLPPGSVGERNPLLVFGRTPLFSYLAHIGIYLALGRLLTPDGTSLGVMVLVWLAGLGMLYFLALGYSGYKSAQPPRSWVRFF